MTTRYVALLRGINLGGSRRVAMPDLKVLFEDQGFSEVRTLINSGNVVFAGTAKISADKLEAAVAERFGMTVDVMLRTTRQIEAIVAANPFPEADTRFVHVGYMRTPPAPVAVQGLDVADFEPEQAVVKGSEVYFHLPDGMGRTKLPGHVGRRLAVPTTIRNWNTTTRLLEMLKGA